MNARQDPEAQSLTAASLWQCAVQAAVLLAIDPSGLAGVRVRAAPGPVRDAWLALLRHWMGDGAWKRIPVNITDERLLGGLDLSATLSAARPVLQRGLLSDVDGGALILTMAERLPPQTAAKLAAVIDHHHVMIARDGLHERHDTRFALVALDEGAQDDEALSPALRERLAFDIDLRAIPWQQVTDDVLSMISPQDIRAARERLAGIVMPDDLLTALCGVAMGLGIGSARASLMALAAARANAALDGNEQVSEDDARVAASLVLAPRATRLPPAPEADDASEPAEPEARTDPPEQEADDPSSPPSAAEQAPLEDRVLDAAKAALPAGLLLQMLEAGALKRGHAGKSGAAVKAGLRGRPAGSRRARPVQGSRLHLIDTLRAAAPWQRLRQAAVSNASPGFRGLNAAKTVRGARIQVRAEDFHVARIKQKTSTATLFVVDASGSSALHRLAEAKGAVELLLADCYVRRDQVALMAFRGQQAELLLPPTRSLVRAKRSLAGLPGGGGTPLATAIDAAVVMAQGLQRRGLSPLLVMLTDGRANVARNGSGGRELAHTEALQAARQLAATGVSVLFIDTSPKPQPLAAELASAMRARYLPLPHAGAAMVSQAVREVSREVTRDAARHGAR
ncbi:MAG: magnesium chelatase subunit D [Oxalobacteraceae bacterium]